MALRDLKIGTRLGLGFALVLGLAAASGVVAVLRVERLAGITRASYEHPFTVSLALRDVRIGVLEIRSKVRQSQQTTDLVELAGVRSEIDDLEAKVHRQLDLVEERYQGRPEDVRAAHALFRAWKPLRDELLAAARLDASAGVLQRLLERRYDEHLDRLDLALQGIVESASRGAEALSKDAAEVQDQTLRLLYLLLAGTLLAGLLLSVAITRGIAGPLRRVVGQIQRVAAGELAVEVDATPRDELGELARALQEMVDALKGAVGQAGRVARGDFSATLEPRSPRDELGAALGAMTYALRETAEENRRAGWLKLGQGQLDAVLRGDRPLGELADATVAFLARYLDAPVGALYAAVGGGQLELAGRYAVAPGEGHPSRWRLGEGLVGQAALERRTIVADVPPDYLQVSSGLGRAAVRVVTLVPLMRGDALLGVLELGGLQRPGDDQLTLLGEAAGPIAVALLSASARVRLEEALATTQEQAHHLQSQQEELRVANEELSEQASQLRESRARLQDQQEELRASNEELEGKTTELEAQARSLEAHNRQLATARREVEEQAEALAVAGRYKSQFLANMSHELRTPLNSVLLLARSLIDNRAGNLSAEQVESARVIQKSGQDLLHLVNEVLDLSKIEAGRMEPVVEPVRLADAAASLRRELIRVAEEKGLTLGVEVAPEAPEVVETDRRRLDQILRNLLSNALKFTAEGHVRLRIRPAAPGPGPVEAVAFEVEDTGIGIPEAEQRRVFEAFHQGEGGTARRFGGTGLGLTISRELAHLLGGELTLRSDPGQGTTFTLVLPVRPRPPAAAGEPPRPAAPPPAPRPPGHAAPPPADDRGSLAPGDRVVLVVEDDPTFAGVLLRQCHQHGLRGLLAGDGRAGLELAEAHRPAAIILDLLLPGTDGWAVLDALKRTAHLRHIPVHLMSAQAPTLDAQRRGAVAFLEKPVSAEQLEAVFGRIRGLADQPLRRLLVVEDDPALRRQVVALVGGDDVTCLEAGSGEEALAALRAGPLDCVVLDLGLPDLSGFDLLDRLHAEGVTLPPVVVYTGRELTREEHDRLQRHAESIIVKGVKSEERLLDETSLFLHRVVSELPEAQRRMIASLHDQDARLAGKRLLLVDDDMRNTFALAKVLRERELEVHIASDGAQALAFLEAHPDVDLVLMDVMMPEVDGYEATRRLRAQPRFRRLPIIALTAKAMKDDRERCMQAGASDYLPKPVDLERLLSMLRVWLYR
jgi:CheY-like chemotaxis protein/HAMP domain-containing protein